MRQRQPQPDRSLPAQELVGFLAVTDAGITRLLIGESVRMHYLDNPAQRLAGAKLSEHGQDVFIWWQLCIATVNQQTTLNILPAFTAQTGGGALRIFRTPRHQENTDFLLPARAVAELKVIADCFNTKTFFMTSGLREVG